MKMDKQPLVQVSLQKKVQKCQKHFTGGHAGTSWESVAELKVAGVSYKSDAT